MTIVKGGHSAAGPRIQPCDRSTSDAASRFLEDHARKMRGDVKVHAAPVHGKVVRLSETYGFVKTSDGLEVYFHRNSVPEGRYEDLEIGSEVRVIIAEKEGERGPQASTVAPVGKHHIAG